ncbi:MAG: hypothetical protein Q8O93_04710 [bacterium]|nr:hypothetical protein [bacterium]
MFDDLDKQSAAPRADGGQAEPRPASPASAPQPPRTAAPAKTEDIFAEVDRAPRPDVFKSRTENMPPPKRGTVIPEADGWLKNKALVLALALGGLVLAAGGGYIGLKLMAEPPVADNIPAGRQNSSPQNTQIISEEPAVPAEEITEPVVPAPAPPLDSDFDGLTDEEEAALGTNPNNPDSDGDGLTDREEVKVYGTDQLNADTDGDGYMDGDEVKNGYNPKGEGKLLEIK